MCIRDRAINALLEFNGWHEEDLNNASLPTYHIRPTSKAFLFNITPAPNLTVILEGGGSNNSILEIDSLIHLNGTVLSRGPSPEALNGTLYLKMRRANTNGPYVTLTSWELDDSNWTSSPGEFSLSWLFSASRIPLPAGEVQVKLEFDSDGLNANDQTTFTDEFGIRSYVEFTYQLQAFPRGNQAVVEVVLTDHTNTSVAEFLGVYTLFLNGTEEWNVTNPDIPRLDVAFTPLSLIHI